MVNMRGGLVNLEVDVNLFLEKRVWALVETSLEVGWLVWWVWWV